MENVRFCANDDLVDLELLASAGDRKFGEVGLVERFSTPPGAATAMPAEYIGAFSTIV